MEVDWPMQEDSHDGFGVLKLQLLLRRKGKCACEFVHFEFLNWCSEILLQLWYGLFRCGYISGGIRKFAEKRFRLIFMVN